MERLNNGAEVLQRQGDVVLCRWSREYHGGCAEFVTWRTDDKGNAYWGHYFKTLVDAAADFAARVQL